MWSLAISTLRYRRSAFVAVFVSVFLGAAIIIACGGLMETGIRLSVPPQRLAATTVVVTGDQTYTLPKANPGDDEEDLEYSTLPERVRVDAATIAKIAAVPGVEKAVPDLSFAVALGGQAASGHNWSSSTLMPYRLAQGTAPANPGDIVLDPATAAMTGKKAGDQVRLSVAGAAQDYRVTGVTGARAEGGPPVVFFADADAQRLAGRDGAADAVGVVAASGTDPEALKRSIESAVRGQPVVALTGDDRGLGEFPQALSGRENLIVLAAVFGAMAIMVAMFVVASTLGLSVQQRHREMALLRAIGTTPGQVRRMVLGEALVVASIATLVGCLPGFVLGRWLFDRLVSAGIATPAVQFHQGLLPAVVGVAVSMLTVVVAAYVTARRAAATKPTEALAAATLQPYRKPGGLRLWAAVLFLVGGVALAFVTVLIMSGTLASSTAGPAVLVWALALALLAPGITRLLTELLGRPIGSFTGPAGYLAVLNSRARTVRMAAAITPVMLATGMATGNLYMQTTQIAATEHAYAESLRADVVLTSSTGGLPAGLLDTIRKLPEVGPGGASAFASSTAFIEKPHDNWQREEGWPVQGVTAEAADRTIAATPTAGKLSDLRGQTVALAEEHAKNIGDGVNIGDTVTMRLGDRSAVEVKVVALFAADTGDERFIVPADLLAPHTTVGQPSQILVKGADGTDPERLTTVLAAAAKGNPEVTVADRETMTAGLVDAQQTQAWVNYLLVGMVLAYTAISVVNTQVMATARRRREFGLQRLTGSTRAQVMRMMGVESALVAGIGILLGTVASLISLVPYSIALDDTPFPSGPLWIYFAILGFAVVLTVGATLVPTWQAMRDRPAEAAMTPE